MSSRRPSSLRFTPIVLAATFAFGACGSTGDSGSESDSATVDGDLVAVGAAPLPADGIGSIRDAVEVVAAAPGQASTAACTVDRQTLQLAVETYLLLNGTAPGSEDDLLEAQLIREPSPYHDLGPGGSVIPAAGSSCT